MAVPASPVRAHPFLSKRRYPEPSNVNNGIRVSLSPRHGQYRLTPDTESHIRDARNALLRSANPSVAGDLYLLLGRRGLFFVLEDQATVSQAAARSYSFDAAPDAMPASPVLVTLGEGDVAWTASPARQLHDRLLESFAAQPAPAVAEKVLPLGQRALILVASVTILWSLIGLGIFAVLR
ncbi:MAG: hypothetical protein QM688_06865 [Sphingomonas bacterium]